MATSQKRTAVFNYEELCFVCQSHKKDPGSGHRKNINVKPVPNVQLVKAQYELWKNKSDCPVNITAAISVLDEAFAESDVPALKWHNASCRVNFMSKSRLDRCADRVVSDLPSSASSDYDEANSEHTGRFLRSQASVYEKDTQCALCSKGVENGELSRATSFNTHEKLQKIAERDTQLMVRLGNAFDAIAGDILYHPLCMLQHIKAEQDHSESDGALNQSAVYDSVFNQLRKEIISRTYRGQAVLVSDCWDRFRALCQEYSLRVPYYFEAKRRFFRYKLLEIVPEVSVIPRQCGDIEDDIIISSSLSLTDVCGLIENEQVEDIQLPAYNENEMTQMVHVALYLRSLILEHEPNHKAQLTEENAYASVPEALYVFMAIMHSGTDALEDITEESDDEDEESTSDKYQRASKLRKCILDVCQDLTYTISGGKIIPPKQYSLGLTVHQQSGRNKKLVELLHKARQTISYKQCIKADTALSEDSLKSIDSDTGAVIPNNMVHGRALQFGQDNIDCSKESAIAGHSAGYHGTQMVAYQPGPKLEVDISEIKFSSRPLQVPDAVHRVQELNIPIVKEPPFVLTENDVDIILDQESTGPGKQAFCAAKNKDVAFNIYRTNTDRYSDEKSNWTEFNKALSQDAKKPATVVGQMPLLNAKADQHDTIYTCVERAKFIAQSLGEQHIWFCTDQAINAPAQETKWTRGEDWENVHFRLGGLHTANAYMSTIGDHIADSEIAKVWIEAGIVTEGEADKILHGRDFKAGLRLHKITWQAAWRLLMPQLMEYMNESYPDMYEDLQILSSNSDTILPLLTIVGTPEFSDAYSNFLTMKRQDKNFDFFWTYMDMIQILLAFIRAERSDDWNLHVDAFTRMLDSFMR